MTSRTFGSTLVTHIDHKLGEQRGVGLVLVGQCAGRLRLHPAIMPPRGLGHTDTATEPSGRPPRLTRAWTTSKRAAIAAEGYDPDDPAVVAALARVSAVLGELGRQRRLRLAMFTPKRCDTDRRACG